MKELPYLKLFTEARNDPKLRALYKGSPAHFWVWFNLFCYSGEQTERGTISRSLYLIAVEVADGDTDLLRNACNAMGALQLVTCNVTDPENVVISIHNFVKWQGVKRPSEHPDRVKDRVRKCRENKKKGNHVGNTSDDVTTCNDDVTSDVTLSKQEQEQELIKSPPTPPSGGGAGGAVEIDPEPEDAEPRVTIPADVRNHPGDVIRVEEKCRKLFPTAGWSDRARLACDEHPAAWVKEAMQIAADSPRPPRSWRLVETILERFGQQGGPDSRKAIHTNGQPSATRALPPQNVNPPAPKGPPVDPAETEAAIASLRSSRPEFRRKTGGPK